MFVEHTSLPKLSVRGKSNEPVVEMYVNAYVVGRQSELLTNGKSGVPLYYLSLVAPRGTGTSLQAIFARLVTLHSKGADLDEVDTVFLAHYRQRVAACGYTLHWQFEQTEVLPERDLHAVIESNMLTIADPVRAMALKTRKERTTPAATKTKGRASLSSAKGGKALLDISEVRARDLNPQFLLMVPSWLTQETAREQLHFSFLDPRVPWPLDPSWASFLWKRGCEQGEIEPLKVWSYAPADTGQEEEASPVVPFLAEAYYCSPHLARLATDLTQALRDQRLPLPVRADHQERSL